MRDPKSTQEIRDFIISTREVAMAKAVKSARDWFMAWNQAAASITSHSRTKAMNVSNMGSASSVSSLPYAKSTTTSFSVTTGPPAHRIGRIRELNYQILYCLVPYGRSDLPAKVFDLMDTANIWYGLRPYSYRKEYGRNRIRYVCIPKYLV